MRTARSYAHHSHGFGARLGRLDLAVDLAGAHAATDLTGFSSPMRAAPCTFARASAMRRRHPLGQNYRGVAGARGRVMFNSKVIVERGAGPCRLAPVSRGLLLATDAEIDTRPQLEIYTDDVKCATARPPAAGPADAVLPAVARPRSHARARGLLTYAFASDVLRQDAVCAETAARASALIGRCPTPSCSGALA